tara:strand:+ start:568 stop:717 length:150 start_codon:yes stop_codon:yes gene_type:complete
MKTPKKTVSRRKFIKKSSLLSTVPVIAAGLLGRTAIHEKCVVEWKEVAL